MAKKDRSTSKGERRDGERAVASAAAAATRSFLLLCALAGLDVGRQQQQWCGLPAVGAVATSPAAAAVVVVMRAVDAVLVHDRPVNAVSTDGAMPARGVAKGRGGDSPPFVVGGKYGGGSGRGGGRDGGGRTASDLPRGSVKV